MNEVFEVLTTRDLDFVDDKTGRPVIGTQLWMIHETDDPAWHGNEVVKVWIPKGHGAEPLMHQIRRGDLVQITWNRSGKPAKVDLIR